MISLLISLLVLIIIAGIAWYIITLLPLPHPFGVIAQLVLLLIIVLVLLGWFLPMTGMIRGLP
jgi:hypothetical protein